MNCTLHWLYQLVPQAPLIRLIKMNLILHFIIIVMCLMNQDLFFYKLNQEAKKIYSNYAPIWWLCLFIMHRTFKYSSVFCIYPFGPSSDVVVVQILQIFVNQNPTSHLIELAINTLILDISFIFRRQYRDVTLSIIYKSRFLFLILNQMSASLLRDILVK